MEQKKNKISLIQIDRTSAWILLGSIILYMLSGYGMTKGIFDAGIARYLHRNILPTITMIAFIGHTSLAVRTAMMRKRVWNKFTKSLLILAYVGSFLGFVYLELFIMRDGIAVTSSQENQANSTTLTNGTTSTSVTDETSISNTPAENSDQKVFTLEELAKYDGKNGNPAYAAVDGMVYDLTNVFKNGDHEGHFAGQELTSAFYSRHVKRELAKYPIVGVLE